MLIGAGDFNSTRTPSPAEPPSSRSIFAVPDGFARWLLSRHNETQFGDYIAISKISMAFIPRLLSAGRDHYFLLGPRGTGKTFWCTHQYPDALRVDLLNPAVLRRYTAAPEYLIEVVGANPGAKHILIDEIQKAPTLLEVVHELSRKHTRSSGCRCSKPVG